MKKLKIYRRGVLLLGLIIFFKTTLFANSLYSEDSYIKNAYGGEVRGDLVSDESTNSVDIPLNSFGTISVIVTLVLTSILGTFFIRDDLD